MAKISRSFRSGWFNAVRFGVLLAVFAADSRAWHTPPHQQITRAAVESLPAALQEKLGAEKATLIAVNCMLPDRYRSLGNAKPEGAIEEAWLAEITPRTRETFLRIRSELAPYCEMPDGRPIHNVTQNRQEDVASIEHLLNAIIAEIRRGDAVAAAKYMGTLAHLLEDSTSPAHAANLPKVVVELSKQQTIPSPPPWLGRLNEHGGKLSAGNLHAAIELTTRPFTLEGRTPQRAGASVAEAAANLLDRCYTIVEENRGDLLEMVRATYADDVPVMERIRSRAARQGAALLADAYYTALTLAEERR